MIKITVLLFLFASLSYSQLSKPEGINPDIFNQFEKLSNIDERHNSLSIQKPNIVLSNGEYRLLESIGWTWVNNVWAYSYKDNYYYNELFK